MPRKLIHKHALNGLFFCALATCWAVSAASQPGETLNASVLNQTEVESSEPADATTHASGLLRTINGERITASALEEVVASGEARTSGVIGGQRSFYLTDANYQTNEVLNACAEGYHMASLWEILDVSNLVYEANHPDAHTKSDSGSGPPALWFGWIRTGWDASGSNAAGSGNCQNWSSVDSGDVGSIVRLSNDWSSQPSRVGAWEPSTSTCNVVGPVWCVVD